MLVPLCSLILITAGVDRPPSFPAAMAGAPMKASTKAYSVWALPPDDVRDRLKRLVSPLRSEFGGPAFEPHITVVGSIGLAPDDALRRFRSTCAALSPYLDPFSEIKCINLF
ncbi:unnamed protein product [Musa acuminata subsp. malaccensis]|uniref:(wild Malaysian banana) hypothetical protein n=1 Tax=Musa acuminata subsp. malaccensis TaxID=214687 RepID=A0A8D7AF38_MUSAM|nr:unnamed protein product [Musa acuminata subsp. malaccensis]